jgi:hypothetical protein
VLRRLDRPRRSKSHCRPNSLLERQDHWGLAQRAQSAPTTRPHAIVIHAAFMGARIMPEASAGRHLATCVGSLTERRVAAQHPSPHRVHFLNTNLEEMKHEQRYVPPHPAHRFRAGGGRTTGPADDDAGQFFDSRLYLQKPAASSQPVSAIVAAVRRDTLDRGPDAWRADGARSLPAGRFFFAFHHGRLRCPTTITDAPSNASWASSRACMPGEGRCVAILTLQAFTLMLAYLPHPPVARL